MISRKSTRMLADFIYVGFSDALENSMWAGERFNFDGLKNFLYELEYDPMFLRLIERQYENDPLLENFILGLHTGDSLGNVVKTGREALERGQEYLLRLTKDIMPLVVRLSEEEIAGYNPRREEYKEVAKAFIAQLELDGYVYRSGNLYPSESSVIDEGEEQNLLELLVNRLSLADKPVIINHLRLSEEHYLNNKWGDSISNSRNFLEAILEKIAHALHTKKGLNTPLSDRPVLIRNFLEQQGFIDTIEKEAIGKVYGLISNTGSHPNIAEKDQARLMRHLALSFSQFVLLRWEGYLTNNP